MREYYKNKKKIWNEFKIIGINTKCESESSLARLLKYNTFIYRCYAIQFKNINTLNTKLRYFSLYCWIVRYYFLTSLILLLLLFVQEQKM
jgi:hypothetical protein